MADHQCVDPASAHMRNLILQNIAYSPDFTGIFETFNKNSRRRIAASIGKGRKLDVDRRKARKIATHISDLLARRTKQTQRMRIGQKSLAVGQENGQRHMGIARLSALDPFLERVGSEDAVFPKGMSN